MLAILLTESGRKREEVGRGRWVEKEATFRRNFSSSEDEPIVPSSDTTQTFSLKILQAYFYLKTIFKRKKKCNNYAGENAQNT